MHHRFALTESDQFPPHGRISHHGPKNYLVAFGDGRLDAAKMTGVAPELSRYLGPTSAAWFRSLAWRSVMSGNIFNSNGIHVGVMEGAAIFDLKGRKLYNLKGINIYRLSGELVGHLNGAQGSRQAARSIHRQAIPRQRQFLRPSRVRRRRTTSHDIPTFTSRMIRLSGGPGLMPKCS